MVLFTLIFLQIIYGAFTAGLKAGHIYNTFPKMNDEWIAASVSAAWNNDGPKSLAENPATVQFIHRCIAFLIFFTALLFWLKRNKLPADLKQSINWLMFVVMIQIALGIFTLIYKVPLWSALLHQAGAFFMVALLIVIMHNAGNNRKTVAL
jgi:cytochrome c oxidase assembly protein subunit 15